MSPLYDKHPLRWFVLCVFLLLVPCFGFWVAADGFLNAPAFIALQKLLPAVFPNWFSGVDIHQSTLYLQTNFGEVGGVVTSAQAAGNAIAYKVNTRIITYALPFYAALTFATPMAGRLERFLWGLLVYYPVVIFCLASMSFQSLFSALGPAYSQTLAGGLLPLQLIAICYQLSVLILPVLMPVAIWWWQSRESELLRMIDLTTKTGVVD